MITPKFELPHTSTIKEGMKLLVTGVPSLAAFSDNRHSRAAWEKLFLGRLAKVVDMQYCKEGLVGVALASVAMSSTNYVHEDCLMYFGVE